MQWVRLGMNLLAASEVQACMAAWCRKTCQYASVDVSQISSGSFKQQEAARGGKSLPYRRRPQQLGQSTAEVVVLPFAGCFECMHREGSLALTPRVSSAGSSKKGQDKSSQSAPGDSAVCTTDVEERLRCCWQAQHSGTQGKAGGHF